MPFAPIDMPPAATACQLCAGVPGTHVAAVNCTVGTRQLTSPRSVEALPMPASGANTALALSIGGSSPSSVLRSVSANCRSAGVYS